MDPTYFKKVSIAIIICALIPLGYHYYLLPEESSHQFIQTRYQSYSVASPIQPIPTIAAIDTKWRDLGKALFNSPLLSKDNSVACNSCHLIAFGGDDGFPVSVGVDNKKGTRNSPTVLNAVFNFRQFWDGREPDLAGQISGPIHNPVEMATDWQQVIGKLSNDPYFSQAFNELGSDGITEQNIIKAIVVFEESLVTPNAPIDQYLLGDSDALSTQQVRGLNKFIDFGCTTCHQGKNIGGNFYQKFGRIDEIPDYLKQDLGKYLSSRDPADKYLFKVPSLRNIAETAPYFHNGSVATLEEAVDIMAKSQLGMSLTREDNQDIVALLQSFSGELQGSSQ